MKRTHITTTDLKGVCSNQVQLFEATFKGKAKITQKNIAIASAAGLVVLWLHRLIPDSARDEYKKDVASAWAEYLKVRIGAWYECEKVKAAAWDKYIKARGRALVVALTQASASKQVSV